MTPLSILPRRSPLTTTAQSTAATTRSTHHTFIADRHLGDLADDRVVTLENRDAAAAAAGKVCPSRFFRPSCRARQEIRPGRAWRGGTYRRLAGRMRSSSMKLSTKKRSATADRAPEHHRHMGVLQHAADAQIGNLVGDLGDAIDRLCFHPVRELPPVERRIDRPRSARPQRQAIGAKRRPHAHRGLRPIAVCGCPARASRRASPVCRLPCDHLA